jgi:hypothetical protein
MLAADPVFVEAAELARVLARAHQGAATQLIGEGWAHARKYFSLSKKYATSADYVSRLKGSGSTVRAPRGEAIRLTDEELWAHLEWWEQVRCHLGDSRHRQDPAARRGPRDRRLGGDSALHAAPVPPAPRPWLALKKHRSARWKDTRGRNHDPLQDPRSGSLGGVLGLAPARGGPVPGQYLSRDDRVSAPSGYLYTTGQHGRPQNVLTRS